MSNVTFGRGTKGVTVQDNMIAFLAENAELKANKDFGYIYLGDNLAATRYLKAMDATGMGTATVDNPVVVTVDIYSDSPVVSSRKLVKALEVATGYSPSDSDILTAAAVAEMCNASSSGIESITWADLKEHRDEGKLVPGKMYRITDYTCTTSQEYTRTAGHQFDIIVTALDSKHLSEEASAVYNAGDDYFRHAVQSVVSAEWIDPDIQPEDIDILYFLNDADNPEYTGSNMYGPGGSRQVHQTAQVVTQVGYMNDTKGTSVPAMFNPDPDENGNDCWYIYGGPLTVDGTTYDYWYQYYTGGHGDEPFVRGSGYLTERLVDSQIEVSGYENATDIDAWKIWYCLDNDGARFGWADLPYIMAHNIQDTKYYRYPAGDKLTDRYPYCWIKYDYSSSYRYTVTENPTTSDRAYYASSGEQLFNDTISSVSAGGKGVVYRMIDEFGNDCPYDFKNIQFYDEDINDWQYTFNSDSPKYENCHHNVILPYCDGSTQLLNADVFLDCLDCYNNTIKHNCAGNRFGTLCYGNTIENECYDNTFGNNMCYVTVHANVAECTVTGGSDEGHYVQNAQILSGTNGATITFTEDAAYTQIAGQDSNGTLKIWTPADLVS